MMLIAWNCTGSLDIVQLLINAGAVPNDGLVSAIRARHSDIVRLLIASGATIGSTHAKAIESLSQKKKKEMGLE
jgi:hypothetical protein